MSATATETELNPASADRNAAPVRFHLSLNVAELTQSVAFLRVLLGVEPSKQRPDYAKFELDSPPLVLSLEPHPPARGGALNHLGFRLPSAAALVDVQRRLELAGMPTNREEGVECCYAKQTKFWVHDPDGNLWEIYTFDGDIEHRGVGQAPEALQPQMHSLQPNGAVGVASSPTIAAKAIWAHRLGQPFPERVFVDDGAADEVLLQGTFNTPQGIAQMSHVLAETLRVLKPGGRVTIHNLSGARRLEQLSQPLPGPAAVVSYVPAATELHAALRDAGFVDLYFEKLGEQPCFHAEGVELRETRLIGFKPGVAAAENRQCEALYKGPFRQLEDDAGRVYRRGEWTAIDASARERLVASAVGQFLFRVV
jgi:catechol 2,3-dioxygenase-like lactoylglutathione lyase family enzyme